MRLLLPRRRVQHVRADITHVSVCLLLAQVNDQPSDNDLCAAVGVLTQLTQLELVTFRWAGRGWGWGR